MNKLTHVASILILLLALPTIAEPESQAPSLSKLCQRMGPYRATSGLDMPQSDTSQTITPAPIAAWTRNFGVAPELATDQKVGGSNPSGRAG